MPDPGFLGVYDPNFSEYLYATCDISKSSELDAESKSRAFRPPSLEIIFFFFLPDPGFFWNI